MNNHISKPVDTIDGIDFINLTESDISPLVSEAQIKVFYLGRNRNNSYIDKETALQMAKTLRGCPIVGAWREDIEDFGDHGHVITIEDGEIKFACKTVPYGFVAPNARVWFQTFEDVDDFGETVQRDYLMTTGYLWTGQYPEAQSVINEGKGQSMELDEETLDGKWATDSKTGMDFFIINDATFSKLCILGDDVEPCFEGASVSGVEGNFTKDTEFANSLFSMMNDIKKALQSSEGGLDMLDKQTEDFTLENNDTVEENTEEESVDTEEVETEEASLEEEEEETSEESEESDETEDEDVEFAAKKKQDDDSEPTSDKEEDDEEDGEPELEPEEPVEDDEAEQDESDVTESACGKKKKYTLEDAEVESMRKEIEELRQFKLNIENKEKDALIAKYHMLSDEDKADIIAHKEEYSLERIEEKLALLYVQTYVDFSTVDGKATNAVDNKESILNFSLDESGINDAEVVDDVQAAFRAMIN